MHSVPFFRSMKAAGIIAEYNPFHNGHHHHISETRAVSGCDVVVAAMSGDFVQRGMPAVWDKWTRAEHALRSGVDLVIEIPVMCCLSDAGRYAAAGVRLLESLGRTEWISFGSESGDIAALTEAADFIRKNRQHIDEGIRRLKGEGLSYPAARERVFTELGGPESASDLLCSSNDILALEYILAMQKARPVAVRRQGAGYHELAGTDGFMSATGIRELMKDGRDLRSYAPACVSEEKRKATVFSRGSAEESALMDLLKFSVLSSPAEAIDDCPSGGEGLGNLLKSNIRRAGSLDELIMSVKSKRYTYTRISRLCMQQLLGISRDDCNPGYIRVLGFTERGRQLLAEIRNHDAASLPVIININKEAHTLSVDARRMLEADVHAADIYNLISGSDIDGCSDYRHMPVIVK